MGSPGPALASRVPVAEEASEACASDLALAGAPVTATNKASAASAAVGERHLDANTRPSASTLEGASHVPSTYHLYLEVMACPRY